MQRTDLLMLLDIENEIRNHGENINIDIRPIAERIGLDIDKVMEEVSEICETKNYRVGGHMYCTISNVLPKYHQNNDLELDRDHTEGLRQILKVHRGYRNDY